MERSDPFRVYFAEYVKRVGWRWWRERGETKSDWDFMRKAGVLHVVVYRIPCHPCPDGRSERVWAGADDRIILTGIDSYSINGWAPKAGVLAPDEIYEVTFEDAKWRPKS